MLETAMAPVQGQLRRSNGPQIRPPLRPGQLVGEQLAQAGRRDGQDGFLRQEERRGKRLGQGNSLGHLRRVHLADTRIIRITNGLMARRKPRRIHSPWI
jgi:hypothetical protein